MAKERGKERHDWLRTGAIIAAVIVAIFFFIWLMCGWHETGCSKLFIAELGLPGPELFCSCGTDGGGGDGDGDLENPPVTTCPPINTKMRSALGTLLANQGITACRDAGGIFFDSSTQFLCQMPVPTFDCHALEYGTDAASVSYRASRKACVDAAGMWYCSPVMMGCYCPGSQPFPNFDCDWMYSTEGGLRCSGGCDETGTICKQFGDYCECATPEGDGEPEPEPGSCGYYSQYVQQGADYKICYNGECPQGQYCMPSQAPLGCYCTGDFLN
jgi:hypothetical protein